ncbi:hypothetical protein EDC36_104150 [Tepidimonas ignava]|uniref:IrrE N-terminal-like domain-containing protein n=1 Tax=Tepidimonas ignava TaxID=114249 RepID=A0A4R3LLP1_9BURK|nr:hypothetical protein [Tepidimonas ignava]TCS98726.1 hypothetical protein EDC36_104150 [Tepidimonas ignava]TSE20347.1 hypothetical protein Tigna_01978 [Tepidimonas ignava]
MPALSLRYDHCSLRKPRYLKKSAIETVAREARAQLLPPGADALTLEQLAAISDLTINGLPYQLWVSLDHPVTDEDGLPVLGLCEFDPDCGEDAVSVLVSPVGEQLTPELALSTFAHELGHAIFDAPAWLVAAKQGSGLFDEPDTSQRRAYRTATVLVKNPHKPRGGPFLACRAAGRWRAARAPRSSPAMPLLKHQTILQPDIVGQFELGKPLTPQERRVDFAWRLCPVIVANQAHPAPCVWLPCRNTQRLRVDPQRPAPP